ncbi:phospholipase C/P1 nuclease domain-containing protein [Mycena leptocephala]|nr:phospholipase C/P1 nuclease domain-containing protein [Mycena leptocephala]
MDEGYARDCGASGCSISTIANYTQRAGDGRVSATHVAEAVRFLVHFLGNVTQPGHDEALALGGNNIKVTYQGFSDNLHADWDTYMPGLDARGRQVASWIAGDTISDPVTTATRWAADANAFVCSKVMPNGAAALTAVADLYPTLANWLNKIYATDVARREVDDEAEITKRGSAQVLAAREHHLVLVDESELHGHVFLPAPRPMSKAELARSAAGRVYTSLSARGRRATARGNTVEEIAKKHNSTMSLAWLVAKDGVTAPIV